MICARGIDALESTEKAIREAGGEVLAIPADVTEPAAPRALVARAVEHYGSIDILVPNAGGPPAGTALDVDDDAILAGVHANLLTSVRLIREAVPHMRAAGWGRICCITSSAVKQPIPFLAVSNTARTGLWAWSKTAAAELFPDGITLNLVCPGLHDTDRIRALGNVTGPVGDPADFGRIVAFLCSEPASFISGTAVMVDGAASLGLL